MTPFASTTITARDGRRAWVRPVRAADAPLVQQFVRDLSPLSRRNRFFGALRELSPSQLERMTRFAAPAELGLVALAGTDSPRIVAIAQHAVCDPSVAEFAVAVADDWQRQGLGEQLLDRLLAHAARIGIAAMQGVVIATNHPMLALAAKLGFALDEDADPELVRIAKPLRRTLAAAV